MLILFYESMAGNIVVPIEAEFSWFIINNGKYQDLVNICSLNVETSKNIVYSSRLDAIFGSCVEYVSYRVFYMHLYMCVTL